MQTPRGLWRAQLRPTKSRARKLIANEFQRSLLDWLSIEVKQFCGRGAYYVMTNISPFGVEGETAFVRRLIQEFGVAAVPGSSFYSPARDGRTKSGSCGQERTDAARRR